ncbi:MAG TPA: ribosome biogenesis GTP-binding protein YihA/YsxC [Steroidobacteraceae bacterium]|jgi:GTP-binding protein|nr:ribosome biogenesis GTP-binding protein YihA/YsxC [Steroidobacteraceae bacterium]
MSRFPDVSFMLSAAAGAQFPPDHGVEIAFAGRSNAGKSSAINVITARHALARTSKTPGRTRLLNFFSLGADRRIVDLPGYGFAEGPRAERAGWAPLIDALRPRESFRGLFLVVDSRRGLADADLELIEWADPVRRRIHVLLAKADKLTRAEGLKTQAQAVAALKGKATVQLFSALRRIGIEGAQERLESFLEAGKDSV